MESLRDTLKFLIKLGDDRLRCGSFSPPLLLFKFNALKDVYFLWCNNVCIWISVLLLRCCFVQAAACCDVRLNQIFSCCMHDVSEFLCICSLIIQLSIKQKKMYIKDSAQNHGQPQVMHYHQQEGLAAKHWWPCMLWNACNSEDFERVLELLNL